MADLDLGGLILAVSRRLEPIRLGLESHDIPLTMLPIKAGAYRQVEDRNRGYVQVVFPGGGFWGEQIGTSLQGYRRIFVSLYLPDLYGKRSNNLDADIQHVATSVLVRIVRSLIGWRPPVSGIKGEITGLGEAGDGDTLYPPKNGFWVIEVRLRVACLWEPISEDEIEAGLDKRLIKQINIYRDKQLVVDVKDEG